MGLISKKATLHVQHTFWVHFIAVVLHAATTWNFHKLLSQTFNGGNKKRSYVFWFTFFHCHSFSPCISWLVTASISHFVTAATKFSCCSSNKKMSPLFFISRSRSLLPFFSLTFADLPPTFSFSLSFSCSIFQICGHDNLSKLNTLDNTDTETISAFRFRLYWLFCCLCFTRRRWLCDFPPK